MSNKPYAFYLKKDENTFLYVDGNGNVNTSLNKIPLKYAPVDWDDIAMRCNRDETAWGIFTKNAESLPFNKDGGTILRSIYYDESYEGVCILVIEWFNSTNMQYEFWGDGDIDFSHAVDAEHNITVNIAARGLEALINNRIDVVQEIELDDPEALDCKLDGITINGYIKWSPVCYIAPASRAVVQLTLLYRTSELGKQYVPDDVAMYTNWRADEEFDEFFPKNHPFFSATKQGIAKVTIKNLYVSCNQSSLISQSLFIRQIKPLGFGVVHTIVDMPANEAYVSTVTLNIECGIGDILTLEMGNPTASQDPGFTTYFSIADKSDTEKASIELEYMLRFPTSQAKAFRFITFAQKMMSKLSGGQYSVVSNFLSNPSLSSEGRRANWDNDPYNTVVTSGDGIRQVEGAKIKSTPRDMLKTCWGMWCLGYGVEGNVLRIEHLSYFLNKNTEIGVVAHVNNVTIEPYLDNVYNQIKVGYGNYEYDELSGKEEFNTGRSFMFDKVVRQTKDDDCIIPIRADMYGIEWLRNKKNPEAAGNTYVTTIDDKSDNDTFLLEVNPTPDIGLYLPYRVANGVISGLSNPESAINVTLSPVRCFLRHRSRLRSMLPISNRGTAKYQTTDKNSQLVSNYGNGLPSEDLAENTDIDMSQEAFLNRSAPLLWKPFKINASIVPDRNLRASLLSYQYGFITLVDTQRNRTIKGFILDVSIKLAKDGTSGNEETEVTLLSHPDSILF